MGLGAGGIYCALTETIISLHFQVFIGRHLSTFLALEKLCVCVCFFFFIGKGLLGDSTFTIIDQGI